MDFTNILKTTPVEPYINEDGYYPQCCRCWNELKPNQEICPRCEQIQDWSWFGGSKNE